MRVVICSRGSKGAWVATVDDTSPVHIPAKATEVLRTTGAGDVLVGSFLASFVRGGDAVTSLQRAQETAAEWVAGRG